MDQLTTQAADRLAILAVIIRQTGRFFPAAVRTVNMRKLPGMNRIPSTRSQGLHTARPVRPT
ncbi:MAG TPA: hypothetical protein VIC34_06460 [Croceibacterium sp.]|jgi:hypothetical protein